MFRIVVVFLVLMVAGCGPDEGWSPAEQEDGGIEDPMGTFQLTNLGNQVIVQPRVFGGQPTTDSILLIETNLADLSREVEQGRLKLPELGVAGPWVFAVDIQTTWPVIPLGSYAVNTLKLRFTMGSGGTHHTLEADVVGGAIIQVPTAVCRVELFWDRLPTVTAAVIPAPWTLPTQVLVRGTFHRSNAVPNARRSFIANQDRTLAPPPGTQVQTMGPIPPYAFDAMVYSPQGAATYNAASQLQFQTGVALGTIHEIMGPQLLAALITGARFPVPPDAETWELDVDVPNVDIAVVDFGVGF